MKIMIIGSVASGKTTLAKQLSMMLKISHYELDNVAHAVNLPGRPKRTASEQHKIIDEVDQRGSWIFEGVYRETYKQVYERAEVIIFLDIPLRIRKIRIFTRFIKQQLKFEHCHYKSDLNMLRLMYKWVGEFEENKANFEAFLKTFEPKIVRVLSVPVNLKTLVEGKV